MANKGKRLKQFCPKGHDKNVVGVDKRGNCIVCRNAREKARYIPHVKSQDRFCPEGHDTSVTGRTKAGYCKICRHGRPIRKVLGVRPEGKQFCPRGHDTLVVGRDKSKTCRVCARDGLLRRKYQITLDDYNKMREAQNNRCAICDITEAEMRDDIYFCVDHDHKCCPAHKSCGKCVRGLLCNPCNALVGFAKENIEVLLKTIEYLKQHNKNKGEQPPCLEP
jgi:hypothetical protein